MAGSHAGIWCPSSYLRCTDWGLCIFDVKWRPGPANQPLQSVICCKRYCSSCLLIDMLQESSTIMMVTLFWHCSGLFLELYFQLVSHSTVPCIKLASEAMLKALVLSRFTLCCHDLMYIVAKAMRSGAHDQDKSTTTAATSSLSCSSSETVAGSVALRCRLLGNHQRCLTLF